MITRRGVRQGVARVSSGGLERRQARTAALDKFVTNVKSLPSDLTNIGKKIGGGLKQAAGITLDKSIGFTMSSLTKKSSGGHGRGYSASKGALGGALGTAIKK